MLVSRTSRIFGAIISGKIGDHDASWGPHASHDLSCWPQATVPLRKCYWRGDETWLDRGETEGDGVTAVKSARCEEDVEGAGHLWTFGIQSTAPVLCRAVICPLCCSVIATKRGHRSDSVDMCSAHLASKPCPKSPSFSVCGSNCHTTRS